VLYGVFADAADEDAEHVQSVPEGQLRALEPDGSVEAICYPKPSRDRCMLLYYASYEPRRLAAQHPGYKSAIRSLFRREPRACRLHTQHQRLGVIAPNPR